MLQFTISPGVVLSESGNITLTPALFNRAFSEAIVSSLSGTLATANLGDATVTTAKLADEAITLTKIALGSIDGSVIKVVADDNTVPGVLLVHYIPIDSATAGNFDVTLGYKFRVLDFHCKHLDALSEASDTIQLFNGANAISDALDWSGATDNSLVRATTLDETYVDVAATTSLRVTTVDSDAGNDVGLGIAVVTGMRVA